MGRACVGMVGIFSILSTCCQESSVEIFDVTDESYQAFIYLSKSNL